MDAVTARSLVDYINSHSTHIFAYTMDFGERSWVILHDTTAARTAPCEEPILEVRDLLDRLSRRAPRHSELLSLMENWLNLRQTSSRDESPGHWSLTQTTQTTPVAQVAQVAQVDHAVAPSAAPLTS